MLLTEIKARVAADNATNNQNDRQKWPAQNRWNRQNRYALQAHAKVKSALKSGALKRGKCWCGSLRAEAHHESYDRPLDVTWLCRKHHRAIHAEQRRAAKLVEAA
jgi:hypothetical protein